MRFFHTTISVIPFGYYCLGVTYGPCFLKFALIKFEVGFCWLDHQPNPPGMML